MKRIIFAIACIATTTFTYAQSERYTTGMEKNLQMLDFAKTTQDLVDVSAAFERIGDAEKTQWLPYYYAALALTNVAWMDANVDKDKNATQIRALVDKGMAIDKNADLYTLLNMAATQQMLVDPQQRWQTYGAEAAKALQTGMQLDPNNPRVYYLQGMSFLIRLRHLGVVNKRQNRCLKKL